MPNYDFQCTVCGQEFVQAVSIKDRATVKCPKCGGKVKQIFTTAGFMVKGGSKCSSCGPVG